MNASEITKRLRIAPWIQIFRIAGKTARTMARCTRIRNKAPSPTVFRKVRPRVARHTRGAATRCFTPLLHLLTGTFAMQLNLPHVVAEVSAAFAAYERAL